MYEEEDALGLVAENRNVHFKGIELVTFGRSPAIAATLDADVRLLDQDGEELAASTGYFSEGEIDDGVLTSYYGILIEFEHPVLIWKALKHTVVIKLRRTDRRPLKPAQCSYRDSTSANNVSFRFEGSCPIRKLLFYIFD